MSNSCFIGKYVCYGNSDGMFCWGRITGETVINTVEGKREVFILEDRMSGPHGPKTPLNGSTVRDPIRHHKGQTLLQKDRINLKKDILDKEVGGLDSLTNEDLFLLVMQASTIESKDLTHRGVRNMLTAEAGGNLEEFAKATLKQRIGMSE